MTTITSSSKRRRRALPVAEAGAQGISLIGQRAEYALRAMALIASAPHGQAVTASEIAAAAHVPAHYLSKVLRKLVTAGLLESQKGHRGGFVLSRPARSIRFIDVLEAVDRAPDRRRCAFGFGRCDSRNPCPLHPAWDRLGQSFLEWTQTTTLSDVGVAQK